MRMKIRIYILILFILLLTMGLVYADNPALTIENFFDKSASFSVYRMQKQRKTIGGGYKHFILADWTFKNISYSPNTNNFFPNFPFNDILTSNSITLVAKKSAEESYSVRGAEITFREKKPLSELGYKLITSDDDVQSKYFYILYLFSTRRDKTEAPYARMVVYLDDYLELAAEIVSLDDKYFISSSYNMLRNTAKVIKNSVVPSLFVLEKPDQTVISVINTISRQVMWRVDNLSYKDQKAVALFAGGLNAMKFAVGRSSRLYAERQFVKEEYTEEDKKQFLIYEDETITPEQLGR